LGSNSNKVQQYDEIGSGSKILFIEILDLKVTKFKKEFVLITGGEG